MVRRVAGGFIRKTLRVARRQPVVDCLYELEGLEVPVVGLEFNLSLRDDRYLGQAQQYHRITRFTVEEPGIGLSVTLSLDRPATLMHFPIETVSESEAGLERTYQGLCLIWLWPVRPGQGRWTGQLRWSVGGRR